MKARFTLAGLVLATAVSSHAHAATLKTEVVFEAGEFCPYYRIPAIVQAANKDLVAFAECRLSYKDHEAIGIVTKRSRYDEEDNDWGPWEAQQFVVSGFFDGRVATNPTPIVNYWGVIVLLYSTHSWGSSQAKIRDNSQCPVAELGECARRTWRIMSFDHGQTWTQQKDITDQVRRPGARWGAENPGHGITLRGGANAGRLVATHTFNYEGSSGGGPAGFDVVYSDNWGWDWHRGAEFLHSGTDHKPSESMPVELLTSSGNQSRLYITSRNTKGGRVGGFSTNGEEPDNSWIDSSLPVVSGGAVQGSILRYSARALGHSHDALILATPADGNQRRNLMLHHSEQGAENSWSAGKLVHRGPAGYSDLVKLHDGYAGMVYESSTYRTDYVPFNSTTPEICRTLPCYSTQIRYARFNEPWFKSPIVLQFDFRRRSINEVVTSTVRDYVGNGLHGTPAGGPVAKDGPPGYEATAPRSLHFDGVDDYIEIPGSVLSSHIMDFEPEDDFTIEVIFRTSAHGSGGSVGSGPLVSKDVGSNQSSYWLRIQDGKARFLMDDSSTATSISSSQSVSDGAWHHLAIVRDRQADKVRLYLDHEKNPQSVADNITGTIANTNNIRIGSFNAGSSANTRRFKGDIALVRVSLAALTSEDFIEQN